MEPAPLRVLLPEGHQPVGAGEGQGAEERRVHGGEDRGVRPDAEREREDDGQAEAGAPPELAERVAQVLAQGARHAGRGGDGRADSHHDRCMDDLGFALLRMPARKRPGAAAAAMSRVRREAGHGIPGLASGVPVARTPSCDVRTVG